MRRAQVQGGIVLNVIIVDDDGTPEWCADWPECPDGGPGWSYIDGIFVAPPEPEQTDDNATAP